MTIDGRAIGLESLRLSISVFLAMGMMVEAFRRGGKRDMSQGEVERPGEVPCQLGQRFDHSPWDAALKGFTALSLLLTSCSRRGLSNPNKEGVELL